MQVTADRFLDAMTMLINDNSPRNQAAVKDTISIYREDASNQTNEGSESDLTEFYIRILQDLMSSGATKENKEALNSILLRFRSDKAFAQHKSVLEILQDMFNAPCETDEQQIQAANSLMAAQKRVQSTILQHKASQRVRKMFGQLSRISEIQDPDVQYMELESLETTIQGISDLFKEAKEDASSADLVDTIDLKDPVSVAVGFQKHNKRAVLGRIKTPFQGLNLALGRAGGIIRGESVLFNALPHNYKSGILLDIAIGAVIHNSYEVAPGKKPLILYITLENEAYENLSLIYHQRYRQETGKDPNLLSEEEMKEWVTSFFQQFDTEIRIERHLPHNFGFEEFMARCNYWTSAGYEIIATVVDYMHNMKKTSSGNSTGAARDVAVKELYNKMRNYTSNAMISLITAHPLNRRCREMVSMYQNAVKRMNIEHLADSIDPEREFDVSIYMNIEKNVQGKPFLTFMLSKHRYVNDTPESYKYWAYPFPKEGVGIHDDVNGAPEFTRDIYSWGFDNEEDDLGRSTNTGALEEAF